MFYYNRKDKNVTALLEEAVLLKNKHPVGCWVVGIFLHEFTKNKIVSCFLFLVLLGFMNGINPLRTEKCIPH